MATEPPVNGIDGLGPEREQVHPLGPYQSPDPFLQNLVRLSAYGVEVGITLTVGGFLVSGVIADGKRYFGEYLVSSVVKGTPENARMHMTTLVKSYAKIYEPLPDGSDAEQRQITFIHLRDARFFHHAGKPIPGNHPIWWRGRLTEVQGFSMGTLTHESRA